MISTRGEITANFCLKYLNHNVIPHNAYVIQHNVYKHFVCLQQLKQAEDDLKQVKSVKLNLGLYNVFWNFRLFEM